jgi:hypothetical protein
MRGKINKSAVVGDKAKKRRSVYFISINIEIEIASYFEATEMYIIN